MAGGQDPSVARKAKVTKALSSANTFGLIADELLDKKRLETRADVTLDKIARLIGLGRPAIGNRPISEITAPEILAILRTIEVRGRLETARRLRSTIGEIFRYAIATGRAGNDPTEALRGALVAVIVKNHAASIEPEAFEALLARLRIASARPRRAMRFNCLL